MSFTSAPAGLGINIGHDASVSDSTPAATKEAMIHQQCSLIQGLGINKVRINMPNFLTQNQNVNFRNALFNFGNIAHNTYGMYVIMGYEAAPLTAANAANFKTQMRAGAVMAASYGIDEWTVGNEEDLFSTLSATDLRTTIQDVCQTIKVTDSFPGTVSTAITTNVYDSQWKGDVGNWSAYMKLNLHIYGIYNNAHFNSYADRVVGELGADNVYCGEFGVDGGRTNFANDETWVKEIKRRMQRLQNKGWQSYYYFAYSVFDSSNDIWSAFRYTDQTHTTLLWELTNSRRNQQNYV